MCVGEKRAGTGKLIRKEHLNWYIGPVLLIISNFVLVIKCSLGQYFEDK